VYGIVKQSKGYIRIQSAPDQGTTVLIFLPRTDAEIATRDTVLIVEPDEFRRTSLGDSLKRCGYEVLIARNGLEACSLAASHEQKIDVLLTEFVMQDMGGAELAERLLMIRPGLQIVFLASALELETTRAVEKLRARVVRKPFSVPTVVTTLRGLLNPPRLIG